MVLLQPDRYLLKKQAQKFTGFINGRVLDVGAGKVLRYKKFFKLASKYVTLDIDPTAKPDVVASAIELPFDNVSFDSVVMTEVLQDVYEFKKVIDEVFRILKPAGHFLIAIPFLAALSDPPYDSWRFTQYGLAKILEKSNFKVVALDQRGGFWSVQVQLFIRFLLDRWQLNNRRFFRLPFIAPFYLMTRLAAFLDEHDHNFYADRFALGWTAVAKKEI